MDELTSVPIGPVLKTPFMIRLVLATGIVSSTRAAERVLLAIALVILILAGILLSTRSGETKSLSTQDIERIIQLQTQSGIYQ